MTDDRDERAPSSAMLPNLPEGYTIRRRSRPNNGNPLTSQKSIVSPLPHGIMPAHDPLDEEIDAAAREGRAVDPKKAFPHRQHEAQRPFAPAPRPFDKTPRGAPRSPAPRPAAPYRHLSDTVPEPLPDNPKDRAQAMAALGDLMSKEEFQHRMMHRLLQRHFAMPSIATAMGVSVRQAHRIADKLRDRYRKEAEHFDVYDYAGRTLWD